MSSPRGVLTRSTRLQSVPYLMRYAKALDARLRWNISSGSSQSVMRRISSSGRLRRFMMLIFCAVSGKVVDRVDELDALGLELRGMCG